MSEEVTLDEFADSSDSADTQKRLESRFWGEVPDHWELVNGSDVYEVNPNLKPNEEPNTYIEMDALDTELPYPEYFGERNASEYSGKTFTKGDTLFARITPCTENGKAALVPEMDTEVGIGSTEYAVLSPRTDRINPWLLYYLSKSHPIHNYAISRMRGSTGRQRVPFSVFRRELDIALPPLSEQRKIATVLYTIDQAIEKTEEIIEQAHTVKKSLMQDVFHGRHKDFKHYQTTPVGEIPTDWSVASIGDVVHTAQYGISESLSEEGQYPIFRMNNIKDGYMIDEPLKFIDLDDDEFEKYRVEQGDILFNRTNSLKLVGKTGIYELDDDHVFASYLVRLQTNNKADPYYLNYYMNSSEAQNRMMDFATKGVSQANINANSIQQVKLPLPPITEQQEIADHIGGIDSQIGANKQYKSQLHRLKLGLMQGLLSGTVRTTDTNIAVPEEITQYG